MDDRLHRLAAATTLALMLSVLGCSSSPAPGPPTNVKVTDITTGRELAPDGTIAPEAQTNSFWTTDTFYASIKTEGTDSAEIKARWLDANGASVAEDSKTINPKDSPIASFKGSPSERWTEGEYKLEILVNGVAAGTRDLVTR
jgi:hypothetical protein